MAFSAKHELPCSTQTKQLSSRKNRSNHIAIRVGAYAAMFILSWLEIGVVPVHRKQILVEYYWMKQKVVDSRVNWSRGIARPALAYNIRSKMTFGVQFHQEKSHVHIGRICSFQALNGNYDEKDRRGCSSAICEYMGILLKTLYHKGRPLQRRSSTIISICWDVVVRVL